MWKKLSILLFVVGSVLSEDPYYFIEKCDKDDPDVNSCLESSLNTLTRHLRNGIPELDIDEVEPVIVDEISIAIGSGPDGYRAIFRDINAYGVSNLTVAAVRSDIETLQFQLTFEIPKIKAKAKYRSSGVLLLVQASGGGDYWGEYDGVKAKVYVKLQPSTTDGTGTYLAVQQIKMDFNVKDISMGVTNLSKSNPVLEAALNLFINSNAQELLKEMKPALKTKLTMVMKNFLERLLDRIPMEAFYE